MKPSHLLAVAIALSFCFGFAFRSVIPSPETTPAGFKKVTGIGGIFFKCKDPGKLREWYQQHLGLEVNPYGAVFEWYQGADSTRKGFTQWSPFKETTRYFEPGTRDFMINYRVADMDALLTELRQSGVTIVDSVQTVEYGKFVHILDLEGNKLELWESNDSEYEKMGVQMGLKTTK